MNNDFADGWQALKSGDHKTALRIWKPLAEQGDAGAQTVLGGMYANGQGVTKDKGEAIKWYRKAAEQGHAQAQFSLGNMYAFGIGVEKNYMDAEGWFIPAADQGHDQAKNAVLWVKKKRGKGDAKSEDEYHAEQWQEYCRLKEDYDNDSDRYETDDIDEQESEDSLEDRIPERIYDYEYMDNWE